MVFFCSCKQLFLFNFHFQHSMCRNVQCDAITTLHRFTLLVHIKVLFFIYLFYRNDQKMVSSTSLLFSVLLLFTLKEGGSLMAFQLIKSLVWSVNTATKPPAPVQFAPCNNNLASFMMLLLISLLSHTLKLASNQTMLY